MTNDIKKIENAFVSNMGSGKIAAANKSVTGISIIGPITTSMMLGGINIPKVPPAVIVPAANFTS